MKQLILMGVSGSGKSAAATALAENAHCRVIEIDDYLLEHENLDVASLIWEEQHQQALAAQTRITLELLGQEAGEQRQVLVLPPNVCGQVEVQKALAELAHRGQGEAVIVELTADLDTLMRRTGLNAPRAVGFGPLRRTFAKMVEDYRTSWKPVVREMLDTTGREPADIAAALLALTSSPRYPKAD